MHFLKKPTNRLSGLTLLEIMFAMLILAGAMIPVASLMGYGGRATGKDARRIAGIHILQKTVQQLLKEPFEDIPLGNNLETSFNEVSLGNVVSEQGNTYKVILSSQYVNPATFNYRGINVNRSGFDEGNPLATDFLAAKNLVLNDVVIKLELKVEWLEQKDLPVSVSAVTYRADFERRSG